MPTLKDWDDDFHRALQKIEEAKKQKAGAVLSALPNRADWEEFLRLTKTEWQSWRNALGQFPYCLIILYDSLAFYEYGENTFWPQFSEAVGEDPQLSANRQREINEAFAKALKDCDLKIRKRPDSTDYVGSAVHHIGVPLSLWDGFLEICQWALTHDNWMKLPDKEWSEAISRRAGGRTRLKNFLTDNREAAHDFIQEMHDARKILMEDQTLTISQLQQASLLRGEYFDEVPETAEFLRPENPESLIRDRARLVWDNDQTRISLQLPAVPNDKLPAIWKIGSLTQHAASTPDTLVLNAAAFAPKLNLSLESEQQNETQWLQGIDPWGLFDLDWKRFVNPARGHFPIHSYAIIARESLDALQRKGFDEEENPINERYELEDRTACYVTRLWPIKKHAELVVAHAGITSKLNFRSHFKIEARMFIGEGRYAANFSRYKENIKLERLPFLCLAIPFGSFQDTQAALQQKFQVSVEKRTAEGIWEKRHEDESLELYFWRWGDGSQARKKVKVSITSPELGIKFEYPIEMLLPKDNMDGCWQNLPGRFLPWVLLAQPSAGAAEGMKWSDLMQAKEMIAPEQRGFSEALLHKYARYGLLEKCGRRWAIIDSRAVFEPSTDRECIMRFCGNPAILWELFRYVSDKTSTLPVIEVVNARGDLPFLSIRWEKKQKVTIEKYLKKHSVRIVSDLWS